VASFPLLRARVLGLFAALSPRFFQGLCLFFFGRVSRTSDWETRKWVRTTSQPQTVPWSPPQTAPRRTCSWYVLAGPVGQSLTPPYKQTVPAVTPAPAAAVRSFPVFLANLPFLLSPPFPTVAESLGSPAQALRAMDHPCDLVHWRSARRHPVVSTDHRLPQADGRAER